ncbi:MAG: retron Ec48 family effector membrane protein [Pseudomonas sp.]|uniref:retron Ec48 family effector membrane protein n=1 Tax=Pseudomonas sp. TaxID=306 RepID=UPI003242818F
MITVRNSSLTLLGLATTGLLIAAASAISIGIKKELEFCVSFACLANLPVLFEEPLEILANTAEFIASIAVALGVIISVRTFTESEAAKASTQKREHYRDFLEVVQKSAIKNHLSSKKNITSTIYSSCFAPDSNPPCLSEIFHKVVQELAVLIDESNASLQEHPGNFNISSHGDRLYAAASKLGMQIQARRNDDIPPHEQAIFGFLDKLSESEPESANYLLEKDRNYI